MRHSQHWRKRLPLEDKWSLSRLIPNSTIFAPILATPTCCAGWDCRSDLFLERRRPRHPHPERSQGRVREAAIARDSPKPAATAIRNEKALLRGWAGNLLQPLFLSIFLPLLTTAKRGSRILKGE